MRDVRSIAIDTGGLLTGETLRELRLLAGFSRRGLEIAASLSAGRIATIENGNAKLHRWESDALRTVLFEELKARAKEIQELLASGESGEARF